MSVSLGGSINPVQSVADFARSLLVFFYPVIGYCERFVSTGFYVNQPTANYPVGIEEIEGRCSQLTRVGWIQKNDIKGLWAVSEPAQRVITVDTDLVSSQS